MYHYTECGLPYIYLADGYTLEGGPFGETVSIAEVDNLHRAIARWVVENVPALSGRELRFLRLEMGLTQGSLADLLGVTEQTVSLAERNPEKTLPGYSDRLLRIEAEAWLDATQPVSDTLRRVHDAPQHEQTSEQPFTHAGDEWAAA